MRYPYVLPPLPYDYDALEPVISAETLHFHHDKHFQTYVDALNKALEPHPHLQQMTLTQLLRALCPMPDSVRAAIQNNGGGVYNHMLYFEVMTPGGTSAPSGPLAAAVDEAFGSQAGFAQALTQAALGQFGSGYAWLVCDDMGRLSVCNLPNQNSPLSHGLWPLLDLDVWEHAYYLDYRNRRAEYVEKWLTLINWSIVEKRYVR